MFLRPPVAIGGALARDPAIGGTDGSPPTTIGDGEQGLL